MRFLSVVTMFLLVSSVGAGEECKVIHHEDGTADATGGPGDNLYTYPLDAYKEVKERGDRGECSYTPIECLPVLYNGHVRLFAVDGDSIETLLLDRGLLNFETIAELKTTGVCTFEARDCYIVERGSGFFLLVGGVWNLDAEPPVQITAPAGGWDLPGQALSDSGIIKSARRALSEEGYAALEADIASHDPSAMANAKLAELRVAGVCK